MPPHIAFALVTCMVARCLALPEFRLQSVRLSENKKDSVGVWEHDKVIWEKLKKERGVERSYPLCYVINGMKKNYWNTEYEVNSWYNYILQNSNSKRTTTTKFLVKGYTQTGIINWVAVDGVCDGKGSRDTDTYYDSSAQPGTKVSVDWLDGIGPFTRCYYTSDNAAYDFRDPKDKLFFAHGRRLSDTTVECPRCTKPKWITKSDLFFPGKSSGIVKFDTPFWQKNLETCISCEFDSSICGLSAYDCANNYNQLNNARQCDVGSYYSTCSSVKDTAGGTQNGNSGSTLQYDSFMYSHGSCKLCRGMENIESLKAVAASSGDINSPDSCKARCITGFYPTNAVLVDSNAYFSLNELVKNNIDCARCRTCEDYQYISGQCGTVTNGRVVSNPCSNCPGGKEPNVNDRTQCVFCKNGKYRQQEANNVCLKCPALQYSNVDTNWQFCLTCMPYQELLQESAELLGYGCADCVKGTFRQTKNLKQTCSPCAEGTIGTGTLELRDSEATACIPCTKMYPERCLSTSRAATPLCVSNHNKTECVKCPATQFPNDYFKCERCNDDLHRFPSESIAEYVSDYKFPCEWRCLDTLYLDAEPRVCKSCHVPCSDSVVGFYRPYCFAGQGFLPTCQPCSNKPGDKTDRFLDVHFQYSKNIIQMFPSQVCEYYCNIGYNASDDCSACSPPPTNAHHSSINDCGWTCDRGYKLSADAKSCEACSIIDYPKRTIDRLQYTSSPYYGNDINRKANFSICHDNDLRVFGEIQTRLAGEQMCGNGLIELSHGEECDDGNTKSNDGCSQACKLENNYHFCDSVGKNCIPNCGYSDSEMLYRFLSDPFCTFSYQYSSNRTLDLKLCGSQCESQGKQQLLDMRDCNSANQGCQDCDPEKQYQAKNTNECRNCGTDCRTGFFPVDICMRGMDDITALGNSIQSRFQFTLAQFDTVQYSDRLVLEQASIGCLPCSPPSYANVTSPSSIRYVSEGSRMQPQSCSFICRFDNTADAEPDNYYCTNRQNNRCVGACLPCSSGLQAGCTVGQYLSLCRETEPPTCKNCSVDLLNQVFDDTAATARDPSDCKTKCDRESIIDLNSQKCKRCLPLNQTTCKDNEFVDVCTRTTSADENSTLEEFGYICKQCPYVTTNLSQPNENKVPVQWFKSPRLCSMDCERGSYHRNGYQPNEQYEPFPCYPCSLPSQKCQANERYIPCTQVVDTACEPCPNISDSLNLEYFVPEGQYPNCETRCSEGYFLNKTNSECVACLPSLCPCQPDICFKIENDCILGYQRYEQPACIQCDERDRPKNAIWTQSDTRKCVWECQAGTVYNPSVRECVTQRA